MSTHDNHEHDHKHDHDTAHREQGTAHGKHDHASQLRTNPASRLQIALALTVSFLGVEVVAGVLTHSLALVSDAVHMLTDAGALLLALVAQRIAARPPTPQRTYGFRRAETLAAFVNGVVLGASSLWIIVESIQRWSRPPQVQGLGMLVVATVGLFVNLLSAWVLSRGQDGHNTNTRAALAHVLADAAGSATAMAAGALVLGLGWRRADPAASLLLSVLILWGAWRLINDAVNVLMEGVPSTLDAAVIGKTIRETEGVEALHDLHVWTVAEGFSAVTVHVVLRKGHHGVDVAQAVSKRVTEAHGIEHVTVQPEASKEAPVVAASSLVRTEKKSE